MSLKRGEDSIRLTYCGLVKLCPASQWHWKNETVRKDVRREASSQERRRGGGGILLVTSLSSPDDHTGPTQSGMSAHTVCVCVGGGRTTTPLLSKQEEIDPETLAACV